MKRILLVLSYILAVVIGLFLGYKAKHPNSAADTQTSAPQAAIQTPTRLLPHQYNDQYLGFQLTIPDDWLNRYAAVENGQSVSFAFENNASIAGTNKLSLSEVFTIDRYSLKVFNAATCGCTEIKRNDTYVFAYNLDGIKTTSLNPPLTPAGIAQELNTAASTFQIN